MRRGDECNLIARDVKDLDEVLNEGMLDGRMEVPRQMSAGLTRYIIKVFIPKIDANICLQGRP